MSAPPPISVLLPVRDGEPWLAEAIASLEGQTESGFEVVAVDDGSVDRTSEILSDWAARDRRVRVLRQSASGIVAALERARQNARGRWWARMDADDVCAPERFARQRELMERQPFLAACGTFVRYFPRERVRAGARRYEAWMNSTSKWHEIERELFVECPIAHPTLFARAEAVAAIGGYRDRGWPEDYDLVLRLWASGAGLEKVPEVLVHWREGPARLSRTAPPYTGSAFLRCKVHFLRETLLEGPRPAVVWGAGPVGKAFARALRGAGAEVAAFVEVDPRKVGQEIHGAPVVDTVTGLGLQGLHLAAVGQPGARAEIRRILTASGRTEMRDFVAVA
jgi:glycosyltransferase involved in cell wall biosynthesis